jgi:hypothetical protein
MQFESIEREYLSALYKLLNARATIDLTRIDAVSIPPQDGVNGPSQSPPQRGEFSIGAVENVGGLTKNWGGGPEGIELYAMKLVPARWFGKNYPVAIGFTHRKIKTGRTFESRTRITTWIRETLTSEGVGADDLISDPEAGVVGGPIATLIKNGKSNVNEGELVPAIYAGLPVRPYREIAPNYQRALAVVYGQTDWDVIAKLAIIRYRQKYEMQR